MNHPKREQILSQLGKINSKTNLYWKGTPGVGDFMYGLNIAHWRSFIMGVPININFHWMHNSSYLHHYEDPETIYDRLTYINNLYLKTHTEVNITHTWDSDSYKLQHDRFWNYTRKMDPRYKNCWAQYRHNDWLFRPEHVRHPVIPNKIVLWRPTFNAQEPRSFKQPFETEQWLKAIDMIEMHGYKVIEIDYRTPVSEAFYHIKTCRATVSYEGMWHYVAKNLCKPMIVLSSDPITLTHTPDALIYNPRKKPGFDPKKGHKPIFTTKYFLKFDKRIEVAQNRSKTRMKYLKELFDEYRQSSN